VPRIEREGEGPSSEGERPGHATRTGRICSRRRQARTAQPSSHVTQLPAQLPAGSPHKEPGRARLLLCPPGCLPCPHPRWHLTEAYTLRNTPLHPSRAYGSCRVEGSAESVGDLFSSKRFQPTFWFVASSASGWLRDALQGRRETANSEAISSPIALPRPEASKPAHSRLVHSRLSISGWNTTPAALHTSPPYHPSAVGYLPFVQTCRPPCSLSLATGATVDCQIRKFGGGPAAGTTIFKLAEENIQTLEPAVSPWLSVPRPVRPTSSSCRPTRWRGVNTSGIAPRFSSLIICSLGIERSHAAFLHPESCQTVAENV
jgi:hypothetical protein